MSDIDQIEDLIENSDELTSKQKGPLRWAVRKVREELTATIAPKPYRESRFTHADADALDALDAKEADPFEEDVPF
jgi:hypothetical protein